MLFPVLGLVLLAALATGYLLWWRECRRLGQRASWRGLALPLLVVVLGGLGYLAFGMDSQTPTWVATQQRYADAAQRIIHGKQPADNGIDLVVGDLARVLQARLVNQPSKPGWYTLGLLYDRMGAPARAQEAARRALELAPEDTAARLLLARTLIEQAGGRLTDQAHQVIRTVLAHHPDHEGAWLLQATAASRARRYRLAAEAWRQLLRHHDEGEVATLMRERLAHARQQLTLAAKLDQLRIKVRGDGLPTGGTLFVFLREEDAQGGRPLAARRVLVEAFPVTVTLGPGDWLRDYPDDLANVRVAARYAATPGAPVADANLRSPARPLHLKQRPAATLTLSAGSHSR